MAQTDPTSFSENARPAAAVDLACEGRIPHAAQRIKIGHAQRRGHCTCGPICRAAVLDDFVVSPPRLCFQVLLALVTFALCMRMLGTVWPAM